MSLLFSVRSTTIKFMHQLELTFGRFTLLSLACLGAGVGLSLAMQIFPFAWAFAIPLFTPLCLHVYGKATRVLLSDREDGTYRTLRASGLHENGYLLGSALVLVLSFAGR